MFTAPDKGDNGTTIFIDEKGLTNVMYQGVPIVKFNNRVIILHTGGHYDMVIKNKMNTISNTLELDFKVLQRAGQWICVYHGREYSWGAHGVVILGRSN